MDIDYIISKEQAHDFAIFISANDIAEYIKEHKEEFEEWEKNQIA